MLGRASRDFLLGTLALAAALGFAGCSSSRQIRVYVEPTYERDRLQQILLLHPEVRLVYPGTEDVALRVEALADDPAAPRRRRALIRARARADDYQVYAVAELLRAPSERGGRARWAASYESGVREDDIADILFEVVREAAGHAHPGHQHPVDELVARLASPVPAD